MFYPNISHFPPHTHTHTHTHLLQSLDILNEEPVCIEPWQEHILDDVLHSLLLEPQRLCPHHGGVDQVEAEGIGSMFLDHLNWIWVVLETFAHLLAITMVMKEEEGGEGKREGGTGERRDEEREGEKRAKGGRRARRKGEMEVKQKVM